MTSAESKPVAIFVDYERVLDKQMGFSCNKIIFLDSGFIHCLPHTTMEIATTKKYQFNS